MKTKHAGSGFTVIEILVSLFIFTTIIMLPTLFFWGIGRNNDLEATTREVISAINGAQANTISGKSTDGQQPISHGIHFAFSYYVVFTGASYNPNDSNNARNDLSTGMSFSQIQLPNSEILFEKVTGKVLNYDADQNYIVLRENNTQKTKRITVSSAGAANFQ